MDKLIEMNTKKESAPTLKKSVPMATFERCEHFRVRAGLSKADLVQLLDKKPKEGSIDQLEAKKAIRAHGAFRVANVLHARLKNGEGEPFEIEKEVKIVKVSRK